ncbi:3603_t:CDS:2, partial [Rhizophagus irregularis]
MEKWNETKEKGEGGQKGNGRIPSWNKCQNFFSEYKFQKRWRELLTGFLAAKKYLKRALRQVVTSWALCHTSRSFNAGIQSIQRIEDYNSLIKRLVKSSATLFELDTHIQSLLNKEENLNSMNNQIKIQQWMQHNQMNKSLLYRANRITIDEGQDENGEDDEDYEDSEDGDDGDYGDNDDNDEQSDDEEQSDDKEQSDDEKQSDGEEQSDDEEQDNIDTRSEKLNFPEDDYKSSIVNLHALITYLNHANIHEAMFHIGLIPDRWYNEKFPDFQEEPAIAIYSEKNTVNPTLLHEIHHTQAFSETAKQNLSHKAKYNQGFGYVKKAIRLALEIGCTDELNGMLQRWIREKENETRSRQLEIDKENLPNISNPYQTRIKGAPRKHIKNALEDNQKQKLSGSASTQRS